MDADDYDRWYETPGGRWIGQREAALVLEALEELSAQRALVDDAIHLHVGDLGVEADDATDQRLAHRGPRAVDSAPLEPR